MDKTCKTRMIKLLDDRNQPYVANMPLDWLYDDADEQTSNKVRAHSARISKTRFSSRNANNSGAGKKMIANSRIL